MKVNRDMQRYTQEDRSKIHAKKEDHFKRGVSTSDDTSDTPLVHEMDILEDHTHTTGDEWETTAR